MAFTIDEAGYADILKRVRDDDFDRVLHEWLELAGMERDAAFALAEAKSTGEQQKVAAAKYVVIQCLKAKLGVAGST